MAVPSPSPDPHHQVTKAAARWPGPVKSIADRLVEEHDPMWQFRLYLDLAEFHIKLIASWAVQRMIQDGGKQPLGTRQQEGLRKALADLRGRPTLGEWMAPVKLAVEMNVQPFHAETANRLDQIISLRNNFAHGTTPTRSDLIPKVTELSGALGDVLTWLVDEDVWLEDEPPFIAPEDSPNCGRLLLRHRSEDVLPLFPWMISVHHAGSPEQLLIFDGLSPTGEPWFLDTAGERAIHAPEDVRTRVVDECRRHLSPPDVAVRFESLIHNSSDVFSPDSPYVTFNRRINTLRSDVANSPEKIHFLQGDAGTGKTTLCCQVVASLEQNPEPDHSRLVIRHFCGLEADSLFRIDPIENLERQLRAVLGADGDGPLQTLVARFLEPSKTGLWILVDALDELEWGIARELIERLKVIKRDCQGPELTVIVSGRPYPAIRSSGWIDDRVHVHRVRGLEADEVDAIADKLELRHVQWSAADTRKLLRKTNGLAIYVHSFLASLAKGDMSKTDLDTLPQDMKEYWERLLKRVLDTCQPEAVLAGKHSEVGSLLYELSERFPNVISKDELAKVRTAARQILDERHSDEERMLPLYVLAAAPIRTSIGTLAEVLGVPGAEVTSADAFKRIERRLKPFGALLHEHQGSFGIYHHSVEDFLHQRPNGTLLARRADALLDRWLNQQPLNGTKLRVWFEFLPRWHRRLQNLAGTVADAEATGLESEVSDDAIQSLLKHLEDFDFLARLCEQGLMQQLESVCRILCDDDALARIQASFNLMPQPLGADLKVARDIWKVCQQKRDEAREREPGPDLDGLSEEELEALLAADMWREANKPKPKTMPMSDRWFAGRYDTRAAMTVIRGSYTANCAEAMQVRAPGNQPRQRLKAFTRFLHEHKVSFGEVRVLPPQSLRQAMAYLVLRSPDVATGKLGRAASEVGSASDMPSIVMDRPGTLPPGSSEWLHWSPGMSGFIMAVDAPVLVALDKPKRGEKKPARLCWFDWLGQEQSQSHAVGFEKSVYLEGVAGDASRVLVSIDGRLTWISLSGEYTELNFPKDARIRWINPDAKFLAYELEGCFHIYDCVRDTTLEPALGSIRELNGIQISEDGQVAVYLSYRYFKIWTATHSAAGAWLECYPGELDAEEKPRNFVLSPNGRFLYLRGAIWEVSTGKIWREIDNIEWSATAAFSRDGRILALMEGGGLVKVYDVGTAVLIGWIPCRAPAEAGGTRASISFSPAGDFLLLHTHTERFAVVDLSKSVPAPSNSAPGWGNWESVPTAPGLEWVTLSDGESRIVVTDLARGSSQTFDPPEDDFGFRPSGDASDLATPRKWIYKPPSKLICMLPGFSYVSEPGLILRKVANFTWEPQARIDLRQQNPDLDWVALAQLPEWSDNARTSSLHERHLKVVGFADGRDDEVIAVSYPNLLLHISLPSGEILSAANTGNYDFDGDTAAVAEGTFAFNYPSGMPVGNWNYRANELRMFAADGELLQLRSMTVERVIPFPWLGKLVLVDQWKGVFAIVEVDKCGDLAFNRREPVPISGHLPAFSLANTPWMVAASPFRGDNDMSSFGVFLLNPFTGETCAHLPVEQPIHTIIQTGDRGFCICFKDGSLLPFTVRFPSPNSGA